MSDVNDWNKQIIAEFRANGGKVGGNFDGATLLILHSTGAKSGEERLNPMIYQAVDGGWAVFASFAGAPHNPAWYHNLKAHPEVSIEVGTDTVPVTAREAVGDERETIWSSQKAAVPQFAEYETKTDRQIPVLVLERRA